MKSLKKKILSGLLVATAMSSIAFASPDDTIRVVIDEVDTLHLEGNDRSYFSHSTSFDDNSSEGWSGNDMEKSPEYRALTKCTGAIENQAEACIPDLEAGEILHIEHHRFDGGYERTVTTFSKDGWSKTISQGDTPMPFGHRGMHDGMRPFRHGGFNNRMCMMPPKDNMSECIDYRMSEDQLIKTVKDNKAGDTLSTATKLIADNWPDGTIFDFTVFKDASKGKPEAMAILQSRYPKFFDKFANPTEKDVAEKVAEELKESLGKHRNEHNCPFPRQFFENSDCSCNPAPKG